MSRAQSASAQYRAAVRWAPVAWRGIPIPSRPQQNGLWGEAILSQVPARVDGIQRDSVVGSLRPGWTVPGPSDVPYWLRSQRGGYVAGVQRYGATPPHGQGPIAVRAMRRNITAAQINQSGLAAQAWAAQISQWS